MCHMISAPYRVRKLEADTMARRVVKHQHSKKSAEALLAHSFSNLGQSKILSHLKFLGNFLSKLTNIETVPPLKTFASHLQDPRVCAHQSVEIRAEAANCFAEVLRLSVQKPVFSGTALFPVFDLFTQQIRNMATIDDPLYPRRTRLLETIVLTQCPALFVDCMMTVWMTDQFPNTKGSPEPKLGLVGGAHSLLQVQARAVRAREMSGKATYRTELNGHRKRGHDILTRMVDAVFMTISWCHSASVRSLFGDLVLIIMEELYLADHISHGIWDVVFRHFALAKRANGLRIDLATVRPGRSIEQVGTTERSMKSPASHELAQGILRDGAHVFSHQVCHFVEGLLDGTDDSKSDIAAHIYALIYELSLLTIVSSHGTNQTYLLNILPKMRRHLSSPDEHDRLGCVNCFGRLFCSHIDLAISHGGLFLSLLGKSFDKAPRVRQEMVNILARFLLLFNPGKNAKYASVHGKCTNHVVNLLHDKDCGVRSVAVDMVARVAGSDMAVVSPALIRAVADRSMDREATVHRRAIIAVGKVFSKLVSADWPPEWDPTIGNENDGFFSHIPQHQLSRSIFLPGIVLDFYECMSRMHSTRVAECADERKKCDALCAAVCHAAFICKIVDDSLLSRRASSRARAQVLLAIHDQLTSSQRQTWNRMVAFRGRLSELLLGALDHAARESTMGDVATGAKREPTLAEFFGVLVEAERSHAIVGPGEMCGSIAASLGRRTAVDILHFLTKDKNSAKLSSYIRTVCNPRTSSDEIVACRRAIIELAKAHFEHRSLSAKLATTNPALTLQAVLQIVSLGGMVHDADDCLDEISHCAVVCSVDPAWHEKAEGALQLLRSLAVMSNTYAHLCFKNLASLLLRFSCSTSMTTNSSRPKPRDATRLNRMDPPLVRYAPILDIIIDVLAQSVESAAEEYLSFMNAPAVFERLLVICTKGYDLKRAVAAARCCCDLMHGTHARVSEWLSLLQKSLSMSLGQVSSGALTLAGSATLAVMLESMSSQGHTLTAMNLLQFEILDCLCSRMYHNALDTLDFSIADGVHINMVGFLLAQTLSVWHQIRSSHAGSSGCHNDSGGNARSSASLSGVRECIRTATSRICDILEDPLLLWDSRKGCMEVLFMFARNRYLHSLFSPRCVFAIGMLIDTARDSAERLHLCRHICAAVRGYGLVSPVHNAAAFVSLIVLSVRCTEPDGCIASKMYATACAWLRRLSSLHGILKSQLGYLRPEYVVAYGTRVIARFSPGISVSGPLFLEKVRMMQFLLNPFLHTLSYNFLMLKQLTRVLRVSEGALL